MKILVKKLISYLLQKKINYNTNKKISIFKKNQSEIFQDKLLENEHFELWKPLGVKPSIFFSRLLITINSIKSSKYVPENIHYGIIEPILNHRAYALTYNDKNFFERYLPKYKDLFPITILRGINGVLYNADFVNISEKQVEEILNNLLINNFFILKPASETGGGENVVMLERIEGGFLINNKVKSFSDVVFLLKENYNSNFVFQHRIKQSNWFNDFNETSLNTVRLYTYRSVKDESVHDIHAYIRFGKHGSIVDSSSQGGRTCGVSREGILNDFALGKYGERFEDLDCIKNKKGKTVPYYDKMTEIAKEIAPSFFYHRLLGFDFSVDENDKIKLMEVNNLYIGVINQQMNSGPLFGDFTDEVINYCSTNQKNKSFTFNFKV